jgi:hypothetical protein
MVYSLSLRSVSNLSSAFPSHPGEGFCFWGGFSCQGRQSFYDLEKWDEAASDALEDLIVQAVRREQQSSRRRRPFSSRSGYTPF